MRNAFLEAVQRRLEVERMEALDERARQERAAKPGPEAEAARKRARRQHYEEKLARGGRVPRGVGLRFKASCMEGRADLVATELAACSRRYAYELRQWAVSEGYGKLLPQESR